MEKRKVKLIFFYKNGAQMEGIHKTAVPYEDFSEYVTQGLLEKRVMHFLDESTSSGGAHSIFVDAGELTTIIAEELPEEKADAEQE